MIQIKKLLALQFLLIAVVLQSGANVSSSFIYNNVTFESPVSSNATLRLASSTGNMPASDYGVESGTTTYSIPAANMPAGVYQVMLIENGTVTGTKKFTK